MTVCIGAICVDGDAAVVASDRMVTSNYPPVEFEHTKQKIFHLTKNCVALTAGNALRPIEIIPKASARIEDESDIESVVANIKELYQFMRSNETEEIFLKPRSISKEVFYTRGAQLFPPDLFNVIDNAIATFNYDLELLIVGVDDLGAHVYSIRNPGVDYCFDSLGFHAIGVGSLHAIQTFIAHRYKASYTVEEAINIVYAAKKNAEVAPGVGTETDIFLVGKENVIDVAPDIIKELSKIYEEVRKPPLQEVAEKSIRLKRLLDKRMKEQGGAIPTPQNDEKKEGGEDENESIGTEKETT